MNLDLPSLPFPAWNADALADAIPLKLSQALDFHALRDGPLPPCANHPVRAAPARYRRDYLPATPAPQRFRVY